MSKGERDAAKNRNSHHHVKLFSDVHLQRYGVAPIHRAGGCVSGGSGEDRQRE
jgi:hypothetical protein